MKKILSALFITDFSIHMLFITDFSAHSMIAVNLKLADFARSASTESAKIAATMVGSENVTGNAVIYENETREVKMEKLAAKRKREILILNPDFTTFFFAVALVLALVVASNYGPISGCPRFLNSRAERSDRICNPLQDIDIV